MPKGQAAAILAKIRGKFEPALPHLEHASTAATGRASDARQKDSSEAAIEAATRIQAAVRGRLVASQKRGSADGDGGGGGGGGADGSDGGGGGGSGGGGLLDAALGIVLWKAGDPVERVPQPDVALSRLGHGAHASLTMALDRQGAQAPLLVTEELGAGLLLLQQLGTQPGALAHLK